jgi:colanic acid biosynthesis glycosyl transferase WcaI
VKILILGLNFAPELIGVGKYTGELAAWLGKRGHEVRIVTAPPYYPGWKLGAGYHALWYQQETWNGSWIVRCPLWVPDRPTTFKRILHLLSFACTSMLPALWQGLVWRPDIVWTVEPTAFTAPTAWLAARLGNATACLHIQDLEVEAALGLRMLSKSLLIRTSTWLYGWLLRRFDHVSTISEQMREQLPTYGVSPKRCSMFPNWVDVEAIRPLAEPSSFRAELGLAADKIIALYAGNMGSKQGVDSLAAVAKTLSDVPNLHFVFAGDGSLRHDVEAMTADLANVTMIPLQPNERFNDLLNLADIHLLPQRSSTASFALPSKFGGMMASGRPAVVQAEEGELATVARKCGIVVPSGDAREMARAVRKLATDAELRRQLGVMARRYAELHLALNTVLSRHEQQLYEGIARRARRRSRWQRFLSTVLPGHMLNTRR